MVKHCLAFLHAKKLELFIFAGTQLVQLGEEGYTRFDIIIKTNKLERY